MKEQNKIPTSKVQRASRFVKTGAKIGGNYVKYYAKKAFNGEVSRETLHNDNAEDIYGGLSELKGGALKVLQMMSMDKNLLPTAYTDRFAMAQYSAPPLSYPLVVNTFQNSLERVRLTSTIPSVRKLKMLPLLGKYTKQPSMASGWPLRFNTLG